MPSKIKLKDVYSLNNKKMVVTHLFERIGSKSNTINFREVSEVDLDNVPPPRCDLHQNRYGECTFNGKKMFMKLLSPSFYKRSKQWFKALKPYAGDLYIESLFDDKNRIIVQPKMSDTINNVKLKKEHVRKNVKKIESFLNLLKECKDESILYKFSRIDVNQINFMIDDKKENFYMIDFDPWAKINHINVWDKIIKEISK